MSGRERGMWDWRALKVEKSADLFVVKETSTQFLVADTTWKSKSFLLYRSVKVYFTDLFYSFLRGAYRSWTFQDSFVNRERAELYSYSP